MTTMSHPLPPPPPTTYPPTANHFCPHLQIEAVGVLRPNGAYYFYCFDYTRKQFQTLECLGCQPEVTERDLYPMYAEYSKKLDTHVCFAFNNLSWKVEQFVFQQRTGGFEEVFQPEMVLDIRKPLSDILCVVKETEEYGMAIIQRDLAQNFKKSRAFNGEYLNLPPVRVKTLMTDSNEYTPLTPLDVEEYRTPFLTSRQFNFYIHCCPRYPGAYLVSIPQKDQSVLRFYFSYLTGDFHPVTCPECTGPVTESFLRPLYAAYSGARGEHVIFVENMHNFRVEQYVLCKYRGGFNQVEDKDLVFDQRLIELGPVILKVETMRGEVHLSKNQEGSMDKLVFLEGQGCQKIAPSEVKTLAILKKEWEEWQKLMEWNPVGLAYQAQRMPSGVPVPVDVDPESESDSKESDSEESETDTDSGTEELGEYTEEPISPLALRMMYLDVSQHQEQPPSEVFTHGYIAPTRAIDSESEDSEADDESDTEDSGSEVDDESESEQSGSEESESASNDAESDAGSGSESVSCAIQKETGEAQKKMAGPAMPTALNPLEVYKHYLRRTLQLAQAISGDELVTSTAAPHSESDDSEVDDESDDEDSGSEESDSEPGPEDDDDSSDGSFEKIDSEAEEAEEDSGESDLEDYDTCEDQDFDTTIHANDE